MDTCRKIKERKIKNNMGEKVTEGDK